MHSSAAHKEKVRAKSSNNYYGRRLIKDCIRRVKAKTRRKNNDAVSYSVSTVDIEGAYFLYAKVWSKKIK